MFLNLSKFGYEFVDVLFTLFTIIYNDELYMLCDICRVDGNEKYFTKLNSKIYKLKQNEINLSRLKWLTF